jgi:2-hydroxychromene-2-carboxylate isomerase
VTAIQPEARSAKAPNDAVFYFDYISPYSFIASQRWPAFPELARARCQPVVFGSILSHYGTQGPGEIPVKRRHGLADVLLLARFHRIPFRGPPRHPFNSIYALRSTLAVDDLDRRSALMRRYFAAAWSEGRDLENLEVLRACLADVGIAQDPEVAASDSGIRRALKAETKHFIERGGFGVPTFEVDGHFFFGQDRMELAAAAARGELELDEAELASMLNRPQPPRLT